jgi:hypothetical protein
MLGVRVGLRCDDADLLRDTARCLLPSWTPSASPVVDSLLSIRVGGPGASRGLRRYYLLYEGASRVVRTLDRDELLDRLASTIRLIVAERTSECLFVHAGVVGWGGRAILIPGATFTGKTSLVTELIRAGATYYSDDCALLDQQGLVHPYPGALSIREQATARQTRRTPEEMGAAVGGEPLPVGVVAFLHYARGATWRPRPLSPARALLALLGHTSGVQARPLAAMEILKRAIRRATVVAGARGEAAATAKLLLHSAATKTARSAHQSRSSAHRCPTP